MELLNYLNQHINWEEELAAPPYSLTISKDGQFVLFKYNQFKSDLNIMLCREARGAIFTQLQDGQWWCVCRALDKFGNWGEEYADTTNIDWTQHVDIQEKIDGSLIKVWCFKGLWHVSTNGVIDAFKAECGDTSYGNVFYSIIEKYITVRDFFSKLDRNFTYWFELVHPLYNPLVVHYSGPAIFYLGRRNMLTFEEDVRRTEFYSMDWLSFPKHYRYNSLDEVLATCQAMGEDEEGYVVCATHQTRDGSFLRIKCKGDEYLKRSKMRCNGPLTISRILEMWRNDMLDDYIAYFPEARAIIKQTIERINNFCDKADIAYNSIKGFEDRREFALRAKTYLKNIQNYLFARRDNKCENAFDFFKNIYKGDFLNDGC